eukprot:gene11313-12497_t
MHATTTDTKRIIVLPTDTDDTVILLFYWQQLKVHGLKELCVKTGVGDSSRFVAFHELAASQSHDICEALPGVHNLTGCDYASKVGHATKAHILRAFFATNIITTLLDHQPSFLDPSVYAFVVEDDLLVPDLGLHPIPEKYSLFCTCGKCSTYDVPVERMAYLVVRFATVKALLQMMMMAQAARTHLVASIELTLCNTVSGSTLKVICEGPTTTPDVHPRFFGSSNGVVDDGTASVIWSATWFWLVTDSPFDHPTITDKELKYLEAELAEDHPEEKVSFFFKALFLLLVGYASNKNIAILELTLAHGVSALSENGFFVNHLDIAPRYAGLLLGISTCFAAIAGMISPTIVGTASVIWSALWFWLVTDSPFDHPTITDEEVKYLEAELAEDDTEEKWFMDCGLVAKGLFAGIVIGLMGSGFIAKSFGWPAIFYFFGTTSVIWSALWFWLVTDSPFDHPTITEKEVKYLETELAEDHTEEKVTYLLQAIFILLVGYAPNKDVAILELTLAVGFSGLTSSGHLVNHLDIAPRYAGLLLGITNCLATIPGILSPTIVGIITKNEETAKIELLYKSVFRAFSLQAAFTLLVGYAPNKDIAILELTLAVGFSGLTSSGLMVNHLDIAPRYASLLFGITNCLATIPGILSPTIVGIITKNEAVPGGIFDCSKKLPFLADFDCKKRFGIISVIWSVFWFWLVTDSPFDHPTITEEELKYLAAELAKDHTEEKATLDYESHNNDFTRNTCALSLQAAFTLLVAYAPNKDIAILELTLAVGFSGLTCSGHLVNHLDIAPRYASLLLGITNCLATIPAILSPTIVGIITKNELNEGSLRLMTKKTIALLIVTTSPP